MQKNPNENEKFVRVHTKILTGQGLTRHQVRHFVRDLVLRNRAKKVENGCYDVREEDYNALMAKAYLSPELEKAKEKVVKKIDPIASTFKTLVDDIRTESKDIISNTKHDAILSVFDNLRKEIRRAYSWRELYKEVLEAYLPPLIRGIDIKINPKRDWEYVAFIQITDTHSHTDRLIELLPKIASLLTDIPGILTKIVFIITGDLLDNTHLYPGQSFNATQNNARQQLNAFINITKTIEFVERFLIDKGTDEVGISVYWCLGNHTREAPFAKGGPANEFDNWEHGAMLMVSNYLDKIGSKAVFYSPDEHNRGYLEVPITYDEDKKTTIEMWPYMTFYEAGCVVGMTHGHTVRMHNRTPHYGIENAVQQWSNQLKPEDHVLDKLFFMGHFHRSMSDIIQGVHFYMGGTLQEVNAHGVKFQGRSLLSQLMVLWKTTQDPCEWSVSRIKIKVET